MRLLGTRRCARVFAGSLLFQLFGSTLSSFACTYLHSIDLRTRKYHHHLIPHRLRVFAFDPQTRKDVCSDRVHAVVPGVVDTHVVVGLYLRVRCTETCVHLFPRAAHAVLCPAFVATLLISLSLSRTHVAVPGLVGPLLHVARQMFSFSLLQSIAAVRLYFPG